MTGSGLRRDASNARLKIFWRTRWFSSCHFFMSSYSCWDFSSATSAASLLFLTSANSLVMAASFCFCTASSSSRACSATYGGFKERVDKPAFLKKVELELSGEMTLETTSALLNGACPSATASTRIVSIDIYKMHRWTITSLILVKESSVQKILSQRGSHEPCILKLYEAACTEHWKDDDKSLAETTKSHI